MIDDLEVHGRYGIVCKGADGEIKWRDEFENLVCTAGKNILLDAGLAGNGYIVTGPYMGLVTATSFTGINVADTLVSHSGWLEATSYNAPRKTMLWTPASGGSKSTASACFFQMTGSDTIRGAFMVFGSAATSTISGTAGVLYSVGVLSADRVVVNGDSISITYTASL